MGDIRQRVAFDFVVAHVCRQGATYDDLAAFVAALDSIGCVHLGRLQEVHTLEADSFYFSAGYCGSVSLYFVDFPFSLSFTMRMLPNTALESTPTAP